MQPSEFFNVSTLGLMIPVIIAAVVMMPLLYSGISDSIMPWKDLVEDELPLKSWSDDERRKIVARRNEERMANAREAWRRGDPQAYEMIGRRRSDYEALGIPFPDDKH